MTICHSKRIRADQRMWTNPTTLITKAEMVWDGSSTKQGGDEEKLGRNGGEKKGVGSGEIRDGKFIGVWENG